MANSVLSAPHFKSEEAAFAYVEASLWPSGPVCPHCGETARLGRLNGKTTRTGLHKCYACQKPFTVRMGTIFEDGPWVASSRTRLGIDAENLDGEFGNYFGAPEGEGILVRGVFADTPAAKAGLKVGDVITSVNDERVRSVGELRSKIAEKQQEKTIKLGLIRNKTALSVSVELPPPVEKRVRTGGRTNI